MNRNDRAALIGMLLGDGSLHLQKYTKKDNKVSEYVCMQITHCEKQSKYIEHKAKRLQTILGGKKVDVKTYNSNTKFSSGKVYKISKTDKYFRPVHRWLYSKNLKKYVTRQVLDFLSLEGIAYWYMDDGGLSRKYNPKKDWYTCEMRFSTYFSEEEADIFINYFSEVWQLQAKKRLSKKHNLYYMCFNATESKKLELMIRPFIIDSMLYKLPSNWIPRAQEAANAAKI